MNLVNPVEHAILAGMFRSPLHDTVRDITTAECAASTDIPSNLDIQLALDLSDYQTEKAALMLRLPLFGIARGDELGVLGRKL